MVRGIIGLCMIIMTMALGAQEVIVTSEIEGEGQVGMPLKGTITITHNSKEKVDGNSFLLGSAPLEAEYLRQVQVAPNSPLTISIYTFTLTPEESGLKELPQVSVTVGGRTYFSYATTYRVDEVKATPATPASSSIVLQIEPLIIGEMPLYPGQRIKIGYRYIFNYSQDLKKEVVPLLQAQGFRKIGGKTQETKMSGKLVHLDILQEVEAIKPGEYHFEPAQIQGRAWRKGRFGKKDPAVRDSVAESAPVSITVLPFPEQDQPASFNGAIGKKLAFSTTLLTKDKVSVGDKMKMKLTFTGEGELATLPMPEICCQPEMSGFFRLSDLPPQENLVDDSKSFVVEMRPTTAQIKEIPAFEFSFFNPEDKRYHTLKSDSIPIEVAPLTESDLPQSATPSTSPAQASVEELPPVLKAIEIEGNTDVDQTDLKNLPFGTPGVIYLIPFLIAGLLLQKHFREHLLKKRQEEKLITAEELFRHAWEMGAADPRFYQKLREAFNLRLVEQGFTKNQAMAKEVHAFLASMDAKRFSGKNQDMTAEEMKEAIRLFEKIRKVS